MVRVTCAIFRVVFDFRPRSLLRNRTETLAMQAIPEVFTLIHTQIYEGRGVSPSRALVLSFAHYFQAPATQAIHFHVSGRHQA